MTFDLRDHVYGWPPPNPKEDGNWEPDESGSECRCESYGPCVGECCGLGQCSCSASNEYDPADVEPVRDVVTVTPGGELL